MRLTLRTLLAYLDDILPAAARQELSPQVEGSTVAEGLERRIRRAVARPEIPAPKPGARGLADDPNSVAEYLDNALPADRIAAFETICLESDMHLAEVAACHGMLAEIARDQKIVKPLESSSRRRLLRKFRHRKAVKAVADKRREARANADVVRAAMQQAVTPSLDGEVSSPPPRRRPPEKQAWLGRASAALALAVLLLAGGVLGWSMARGGRRTAARPVAAAKAEVTPEDKEDKAEPAVVNAEKPDEPSQPDPPDNDVAEGAAADAGEEKMAESSEAALPAAIAAKDEPLGTEPGRAEQPIATATQPPIPQPAAPVDGLAAAAGPRVPQGDALAIAAPLPASGGAAAPQPAAPDEKPVAEVGTVGSGGVLLHRLLRAGKHVWVHFPADSSLLSREELLAPPGCDPTIDLGGVVIQILRGTQAAVSIDADGTPRITVVFGRIIARASRIAGADARLGISVGGLHGVVTAGLAQPVAASLQFERTDGVDPTKSPARTVATIITTSGGIGWRQIAMRKDGAAAGSTMLVGIAEEGMLDARSAIVWRSDLPDRATMQSRADSGWAAAQQRVDPIERRAVESLDRAVKGGGALPEALLTMAADHRPENRSLAASTLAMIGGYGELVAVLSADAPGARLEEGQWRSLESAAVPLALARGAKAAAALRQAFVDRGPRDKAEWLFAMAGGFSDADLAAGADARLVESLDDPDLVVRRYALKNLLEIVRPSAADRVRYRPDGLPEMRRDGAAWWRVQLQKGLVRRLASR